MHFVCRVWRGHRSVSKIDHILIDRRRGIHVDMMGPIPAMQSFYNLRKMQITRKLLLNRGWPQFNIIYCHFARAKTHRTIARETSIHYINRSSEANPNFIYRSIFLTFCTLQLSFNTVVYYTLPVVTATKNKLVRNHVYKGNICCQVSSRYCRLHGVNHDLY